jgi:hypothetical protein
MVRTHSCTIYFSFSKLNVFQRCLPGALWPSFSPGSFLALEFLVESCQPDIGNDMVQFFQGQDTLFWHGVKEETIEIDCRILWLFTYSFKTGDWLRLTPNE